MPEDKEFVCEESQRAIRLAHDEPKHFGPLPEVLAYLEREFSGGKVLEVGPGWCPIPWATHAVDAFNWPIPNLIMADVLRDGIPFPDKFFDFVYCRGLIEDVHDPAIVCKEISRVGKAGYIESPSPVAELARGVDGVEMSGPYRGYHHHRYIVWTFQGQLCFLAKYPVIEFMKFVEAELVKTLREHPRYWNTYHLWKDEIRFRQVENGIDFEFWRDYQKLCGSAATQSVENADKFWQHIGQQIESKAA